MDRIIEFTWEPLAGVPNDDAFDKKLYQDIKYQETWLRAYIINKNPHAAESEALSGWDNWKEEEYPFSSANPKNTATKTAKPSPRPHRPRQGSKGQRCSKRLFNMYMK